MDRQEAYRGLDSSQLVRDLRGLGDVRAPERLLPGVITSLGLGDAYLQINSPVGPLFVAYNSLGISAVMRAAGAEEFERRFQGRFGRRVYRTAQPPEKLLRALTPEGSTRLRSLRVDLRGLSPFEQAVLLKSRTIPRGEVRSYAWIAREIGHPKAVRAVGSALAQNPVPLVIPCHRVVRSDGRLGEYSLGGAQSKEAILAAEGVAVSQLQALAHLGVRFVGSDTTHIFCFPTCRHARRIEGRHRVDFHSEREAVAAGYRACAVCRPSPGIG